MYQEKDRLGVLGTTQTNLNHALISTTVVSDINKKKTHRWFIHVIVIDKQATGRETEKNSHCAFFQWWLHLGVKL